MISIDMSSRYVDYYNKLAEADEICVVGFGFNSDDEHINGIFRELVDGKKKPLTIIKRKGTDPVDTIKNRISKRLKLQDDTNISVILVDDERKRNDVLWIDCLLSAMDCM